jgi:hypothetical protein
LVYVALKKQFNLEGELEGVSNRFEILDQEELDSMEDEDLDGYLVIPLKEAMHCKTRRRYASGTNTVN